MNPFEPWLPMYGAGVVAERPWWRDGGDGLWLRSDGGGIGLFGPAADLPDRLNAFDAYDTAHPLPAPPPMCGQVWAYRWPALDWSQSPIGTGGRLISEPNAGTWSRFSVVSDDDGRPTLSRRVYEEWEATNQPSKWPVEGSILVAGPTPYGRDVPWAPLGWKP